MLFYMEIRSKDNVWSEGGLFSAEQTILKLMRYYTAFSNKENKASDFEFAMNGSYPGVIIEEDEIYLVRVK